MKRLLVVLMAVMAITGLMVLPALGADKLIVKDGASATRFVVNTNDSTNIGSLGLNVAVPTYNFDLSAGNVSKSSMHFSLNGTDDGGFITSVLPNNFFVSSGAAWDSVAGGWIAKSTSAIIAGSGAAGYRVLTASGCTPGALCTPATRLTLDYNGNLTIAGSLNQNSSRTYKDNIETLSAKAAIDALNNLTPVTYNYKNDDRHHVGFIAEDVPDLVAAKDRKSLSPLDIIAVLTKAVQEQGKTIAELSAKLDMLEKASRR